jgi:phosphate transport system permease protein
MPPRSLRHDLHLSEPCHLSVGRRKRVHLPATSGRPNVRDRQAIIGAVTALHVDDGSLRENSDPFSGLEPRPVHRGVTAADKAFRGLAGGVGLLSLVIVVGTAAFLFLEARSALDSSGWVGFFTNSVWNSANGNFGVAGLLIGSVLVALIGLTVGTPIALATAIFINEYAPGRLRRVLVSAIDLLAALPSLIFGLWGLFALQEVLIGPADWVGHHLSAIPLFRLSNADPSLSRSVFITGIVVGLMIVPIVTAVSRDVMSQVPRELVEGALALGGSRWAAVRTVILPFGRSGIIGAALLGFGRALGETIAVAIMLSVSVNTNWNILETNGGSVAGWIAIQFGEANASARSGLIAAGLALFLLTLVVNAVARVIVKRTTRFA